MPELPEIHNLAKQMNRKLRGLTIGSVEIVQGNDACAEQVLRKGVAIARRVRDFNADSCIVLAGLAAVRQGRPDQARRDLYEGLAPALARGSYLSYLFGLPSAALLLLGDPTGVRLAIARVSPSLRRGNSGYVVQELERVTGMHFGYRRDRWLEWWRSVEGRWVIPA